MTLTHRPFEALLADAPANGAPLGMVKVPPWRLAADENSRRAGERAAFVRDDMRAHPMYGPKLLNRRVAEKFGIGIGISVIAKIRREVYAELGLKLSGTGAPLGPDGKERVFQRREGPKHPRGRTLAPPLVTARKPRAVSGLTGDMLSAIGLLREAMKGGGIYAIHVPADGPVTYEATVMTRVQKTERV